MYTEQARINTGARTACCRTRLVLPRRTDVARVLVRVGHPASWASNAGRNNTAQRERALAARGLASVPTEPVIHYTGTRMAGGTLRAVPPRRRWPWC